MSDKTVSVSLKIEEFFDGKLEFNFNNREYSDQQHDFVNIIRDIILAKVEVNVPCEDCDYEEAILNKGESRSSIIKALWEHQKSILPICVKIMSQTGKGYVVISKNGKIGIRDKAPFYDPSSRIITITQFSEVSNV